MECFFFQGRILAYRLRAKTAPPAHPMGIRTPVRAELGGWERTVKVFSETIRVLNDTNQIKESALHRGITNRLPSLICIFYSFTDTLRDAKEKLPGW